MSEKRETLNTTDISDEKTHDSVKIGHGIPGMIQMPTVIPDSIKIDDDIDTIDHMKEQIDNNPDRIEISLIVLNPIDCIEVEIRPIDFEGPKIGPIELNTLEDEKTNE